MLLTASARTNWSGPTAPVAVLALLAWLPLLVRRRHPGPALAAAALVETVHVAVLTPAAADLVMPAAMAFYQPVPIATMVAAGTYASVRPRAPGWAAGLGAGTVLLAVGAAAQPLDLLATDVVMLNLVAIATAVGAVVAARRERAERVRREQGEQVRREVQSERLRIARELHDSLAHHLTLVHAQAGVAEHLLATRPEAAAGALQSITDHTRQALHEVRATVGLLRQPGDADPAARTDPAAGGVTPRLEDVPALVDRARATGQDVRVAVTGASRPLPPDTGLAAYRIVQEALTNAAKHAPGSDVRVRLAWVEDRLELSVDNGPAVRPAGSGSRGGGHGLLGIRERAEACGGAATAEHLPDGGFAVRARLPAPADAPDHETSTAP